jgi:hypothetical protein
VRASAAAPTFFPPEYVRLESKEFVFVDGGVTSYNNPSFLLFMMATLEPYHLQWATGPERMLLVSVGTGSSPITSGGVHANSPNLLENARGIPRALMSSASMQQDFLCRSFGRCRSGAPLDRELGNLVESGESPQGSLAGLPKLFTYLRYDVELTDAGLAAFGVEGIDPRSNRQPGRRWQAPRAPAGRSSAGGIRAGRCTSRDSCDLALRAARAADTAVSCRRSSRPRTPRRLPRRFAPPRRSADHDWCAVNPLRPTLVGDPTGLHLERPGRGGHRPESG